MLLALGWSLAALVVSAVVLALLFQQAALRRIDRALQESLDNLLSFTVVSAGEVYAPPITDERAVRTFSGRYWQILVLDGPVHRTVARSYSLAGEDLRPPADLRERIVAHPARAIAYETRDPQGRPLRARAQFARIQGIPVVFLAAEDRSSVDRDVRGLIVATAAAFLLLGGGLISAIVVQVRVGLRPLFDLSREVAAVRRGKTERLAGDYPIEVAPLAEELNALLLHNQEVVERQRTHVGNLAHALKTPISVMIAEASQQPGELAEVVTRQADVMRRQVDHHLRRARAAARTQGQGERTQVDEVLDELARTLERIFQDKRVVIDWDAADDLFFLGERQDLLEIAGNAIENACKWCRGRVRVRVEGAGPERLQLSVEDDGPGLPPDRREEVIRRGARLDENAPGSGLGLSIIDELARAYGGAVRLADSGLGGLRVEVDLPRAEA